MVGIYRNEIASEARHEIKLLSTVYTNDVSSFNVCYCGICLQSISVLDNQSLTTSCAFLQVPEGLQEEVQRRAQTLKEGKVSSASGYSTCVGEVRVQ